MQQVLTLTADPAARPLDDGIAAKAAGALAAAGARTGAPVLLAAGCAFDLPFEGIADGAAAAAVRAALAGVPADANAQPAAGRRKRLLVADMDSTVITVESLDELADFAGLRDRIAPVTERAMRGEIGFEEALRERVALLAGRPASLLDRLLAERVRLTPGARTLARTARAHGARTALVSGGFDFVTGAVARMAGFDTHRGNRLLVADGRLTGEVGEPILGADAKRDILRELCAAIGAGTGEAMAVGDGANDIPMLAEAGAGVAFRAKPAVAAAARLRIEHGDLTALLHLQGYREEEFAAD